MATIQINIPDAVLPRVVNALCSTYGYQATITNADGTTSPNPVAKAQFAKLQVINFIKATIITSESNAAAQAAAKSSEDAINQDIVLS